MQLQWLKTFSVAATTLNFRKTSELLLMSQPSVTVHIKLLEEFLGVSLFDRNKNSVTLTDAGKLFIGKADNILLQFEDSVQTIHSFKQGFRRNWTIAISPLLAETILPYILRIFMTQHPDLEITIRVEESNLIESLVDSGDVHLGISALDAHSKYLQSIPIFEEPLLFIVPIDSYDDETGPPIDVLECLKTHTLLTHHHPVFWEDVLVLLRKHIPGVRTMKVSSPYHQALYSRRARYILFAPFDC